MNIKFLNSIQDCPAEQWQSLFNTDYPFIQHNFLLSLETSGCTQAKTGWTPYHLIVLQADKPIAAMPCFIKTHSYGEYVFDWSWADAYHQHGLEYYPKLLSAIPFTPATGPRIGFHRAINSIEEKMAIEHNIVQAITQQAKKINASSWHCLFSDLLSSNRLSSQNCTQRVGIQYHWFNKGFVSFNDFLDQFKSRKRKNIRKERQRVIDQGIRMDVLSGEQISHSKLQRFYHFYHLTYLKRSGQHGYLSLDFFSELLKNMTSQLVMICAFKEDILVGAALCFKDSQTLYGRYWGCEKEYDFLHFEACYYQGIEYCIEQQLQRFDPGAQGEHKIPRGFEPIKTYSNHAIFHPEFKAAIDNFLTQESNHVDQHIIELEELLPFKSMTG